MRPIYFKFNNDRQKEYRIKTVIYKDDKGRFVKKEAIVEDAEKHIKSIYDNQEIIRQLYPHITVCKAKLNGGSLYFQYLEGKTFADQYIEALEKQDRDEFVKLLNLHKGLILSCEPTNLCEFQETEEYCKIFGSGIPFIGSGALKITNFEFTSHNIIVDMKKNGYCLIDYEYVFYFPIPISLILYHCIIKTNLWTISEFDCLISVEEMLKILDIRQETDILEKSWNNFESHFGRSKLGEAKLRYLKNVVDLSNLQKENANLKEENKGHNNYISILTDNLNEQTRFIDAQREDIRQKCRLIELQQNDIKQKKHLIELQQKDVEAKQRLIDRQQQRICFQENNMEKQKQEKYHLQALIKIRDDEIGQLRLRNQTYETKISKEIEKSIKIEKELENLKSSLSWRLSSPLRKIADKIRRGIF